MTFEERRKILMADPSLYDPNLTEGNPRFGPIRGIPVGTTFASRRDCVIRGVHAANVAGISGNQREGASSIVLSSGYEDDNDSGDFFIYTGTGGQAENSFAGGGDQVSDQTFGHKDNAALKRSQETGRPVRVIRGPNVKSQYAPASGYRYDGLYIAEKAYMDKGSHGYYICRYEMRRVPGQPPLPTNPNWEWA